MENLQQIEINIKDLLTLMIAGNFTFTVNSLKTNKHYSFIVKRDETSFEEYIWHVYIVGNKSKIGYLALMEDDKINFNFPPNEINNDYTKVFVVTFNLMSKNMNHPQMKIYRSIQCARCGRKLTDPISIQKGIGAECEKENIELLNELKQLETHE